MVINKQLLDAITLEATQSPRLRMNKDMRNSDADSSQRMLNAIEPGTELPIHRHCNSSETVIMLRGKAEQLFYDEKGQITERILLEPNSENVGINIPIGAWHRIVSLEPGTVIFEAKDGAYEPLKQEDILTL